MEGITYHVERRTYGFSNDQSASMCSIVFQTKSCKPYLIAITFDTSSGFTYHTGILVLNYFILLQVIDLHSLLSNSHKRNQFNLYAKLTPPCRTLYPSNKLSSLC